MTIDSVNLMWSRRGGSDSSQDGQTYTASRTAAYQVLHSVDADENEILAASALPSLGDTFTGTSAVFCTDKTMEAVAPLLSIVVCSYAGETGPNNDDNPLNKEPEISYENVPSTEPVDEDFYGRPFTNCHGEPTEGLTTDVSDWALDVRRNFADVNLYTLRQYIRSVNSDEFFGWPPGTAKLVKFRAVPKKFNSMPYYTVDARILFREPYNTTNERAWWHRYRNEGFWERVGTTVTLTGGGGTGATAYAVTSSGGAITAIPVTSRGGDYTTAPTVNITSSTGGTGATATATINSNGQVTGISVGAGGSGYKSKLQKAVDDNGEPVNKPVLLAADGSREKNSENAVWIERPDRAYLPYGFLGLL